MMSEAIRIPGLLQVGISGLSSACMRTDHGTPAISSTMAAARKSAIRIAFFDDRIDIESPALVPRNFPAWEVIGQSYRSAQRLINVAQFFYGAT